MIQLAHQRLIFFEDVKKFEKTVAAAGSLESKLNEVVGAQIAGLVDEAMARLNKEAEKLEATIVKTERMNEQRNKIIEQLQRKIEEVDVNKSEATFIFEFKNVTDFLNAKREVRRSDDSVYLRGLAFDLKLNTKTSPQNDRFLAITLTANSPFDHVDFSIELSYELRLVNQLPQKVNRTDTNSALLKKSGNKLVWPYFATIDQLMSDGFIKNDTIMLEIHLKCDKFVRLD